MQQVLEANHKVLKTFQNQTEDEELQELPGKMLERIYPDLVAIHPIDGLAILIKDAVPQGGKDVTADVIAKMAK